MTAPLEPRRRRQRSTPLRSSIAALGMCVLLLSGCSLIDGDDDAAPPSTTAPAITRTPADGPEDCSLEETVCIGLVIGPGGIQAGSIAYIVDEVAPEDASTQLVAAQDASEMELLVGTLIDQSVDLLIVSGAGSGSITLTAADLHTDLTFVHIGSIDGAIPSNLGVVEFDTSHAAFAAGATGGLVSATRKVGAVLATADDPLMQEFRAGWESGARFIDPDLELVTSFHPAGADAAFTDPEWGAETARGQIDDGVDVLLGVGGSTGNAALVEAANADVAVSCVGGVDNQWTATVQARRCLIANVVFGVDEVLRSLIEGFLDGDDISGRVQGTVEYVRAPGSDLPAEITEQIDAIVAGLADGSIDPEL